MLAWLVNNELEITKVEAVVVWLYVLSRSFPINTEESHENVCSIVDVRGQIRKGHLTNIGQRHCHLRQLFRCCDSEWLLEKDVENRGIVTFWDNWSNIPESAWRNWRQPWESSVWLAGISARMEYIGAQKQVYWLAKCALKYVRHFFITYRM
jgi:hypothetical protein